MSTTTTISHTLVVHEPSTTHSSTPSTNPSIPSKSPTAIDNLNKLPGGIWALIFLVAAVLMGGIA
ncbi:hypothetical protein N7516_005776 [Penicillium verrucosum]|uniref:uncharacterized protein n=1 Tax=Penicillium verrucosum TaxID=60171 RepID=UPI002544DB3D|nr:uncharacterized protein N7516_005776 [Penicillium verrucosum]KAJ5931287.1 hypothetical protein N7516_005776 [Penicillium verrucosum]